MLKRLTHALIALIVALAAVLPVSVRAMPMSDGMGGMGIQRHCAGCPDPARTSANPDKMAACPVLACASIVAVLPTPAALPGRVPQPAAYLTASPVHWTAAARAPDPFPPRPIALV